MIRVGICGYGYWGPNLYRAFASNPAFKVVAASDLREDRRKRLAEVDPQIRLHAAAEELIDSPDIDAVAIATPVDTHFALARRALQHRRHVLVEKPMCRSADQGQELVRLAARHGAVLMVDHTFLFHGAVQKLAELKASGALGDVSYYDSLRVNLGLFQPDVNVLWDLAPHDFSIIDHLFDESPEHVEATGYCHINPHLPDIAYVTLHFRSRMIAHLNLSWMSPVKVRRIAIGGSSRMVVWDDLNREERLKIYDSGIHVQPEEQRGTLMPSYRLGDVHSPRISEAEPLVGVIGHFGGVIAGGEPSIMDGRKGLRVVALLERAQRSLDDSLANALRLRQPIKAAVP